MTSTILSKDIFPLDYRPKIDTPVLDLESSFCWKEDNIIFIFPKIDKPFNKKIAVRQNLRVKKELMEMGKLYCMVCDVRNSEPIDKETREYYGSKEAGENLSAFIFIVDSAFSRVIANFFLNLKKATVPIKMFNKVSEAKKWSNKLFLN